MSEAKPFRNRLNDLTPKDWLKFQKSWFIHNPPPRRKEVRRHPAKFPESMAQEFIEFFTKPGQMVFDPMAGTGSTLVASRRASRQARGVELSRVYTEVARQLIQEETAKLGPPADGLRCEVITGDAARLEAINLPTMDYVLTSPPYCDRLVEIYASLRPLLRPKAYLTIIVKNVKKGGRVYPLAWDLGMRLGGTYTLKDEKIWCQDDIRLAPYGLGNAWVSNTFHHYCLQFRWEP